MAWDVWIHAWSRGVLGYGWVSKAFHSCIVMDTLLNNTWWIMLLEVGFFPHEGFPRVYLVSHFHGYIVYSLHVDSMC